MNRFFSFFLYFILLELMCSCTSKKIQDAESFDWEGNPIKCYQLSEPILHFSIDIKQQILYGVSDHPEFHIVAFPMQ